jgi:hypothetical protein
VGFWETENVEEFDGCWRFGWFGVFEFLGYGFFHGFDGFLEEMGPDVTEEFGSAIFHVDSVLFDYIN